MDKVLRLLQTPCFSKMKFKSNRRKQYENVNAVMDTDSNPDVSCSYIINTSKHAKLRATTAWNGDMINLVTMQVSHLYQKKKEE